MSLPRLPVPAAFGGLSVLALAAAQCAWAQSTPPQAAASPTVQLETVTVTSRRRAESIQEVPMSVTAVSAAQIRAEGASDLKDLGFSIGNYTSDSAYGSAARSTPIIRGVSNQSGGGNGSTTGVYIDDVYIGDTSGNALSLMDVERVEVLRGPQGTLFGKNSISGAVNVTTLRPGQLLDGSVSLTVGNNGYVQPGVLVSGPIVKGLVSGKFAAMSTKRDGVDRVASTGEKVNDLNNQAFRGGLLFTPGKDTDVALNFDASRDTSSSGYADVLRDRVVGGPAYGATVNIPGVPVPLYLSRYSPGFAKADGNPTDGVIPGNTTGKPNVSKLEISGGSMRVEHRMDGLRLLSITASREYKNHSKADGDNGPLDIFYSDTRTNYKQTSQEFRLIGQKGPLDWVAGAYYFVGKRDVQKVTNVGADFQNDAGLLSPALAGRIVTTGALANLLCGGAKLGSTPACSAAQYEPDFRKNTSQAVYGSATYRISDALSVTGGLRVNREKLEQSYTRAYVIAPFFGLTAVPTTKNVSKVENDTSPQLSIAYKPAQGINMYATYGKGYRSGFVNASDGKEIKPESMDSYEVGAKAVWFGGRATTNVAIYRMNYTDMQRTRALNFGQQFVTDNASKARIEGIELDGALRAIGGLYLTLSAGYNDARYISYQGAQVTKDDGSSTILDLSGARMPLSPSSTAAFGLRYNVDIGGYSTEWGGQLQYRSAFRTADGNATLFSVGSQSQVNLYAAFGPVDSNWRATLRVRNVGDKRYVLGQNQSADGTDYAVLSEPRSVTLNVRWDF